MPSCSPPPASSSCRSPLHLSALAKYTQVRVAAVYGGVGFGQQIASFKRGTDIIVATPGRLLDHLDQKSHLLGDVSILVLDEADRMLDMGFLPDVRRILARVPGRRQTLFFSATIPGEIAKLTAELLHEPARVDLQPQRGPAAGITQTVYAIDHMRKGDLLVELLKDNNIFSAIAFTRTKARAERLARCCRSTASKPTASTATARRASAPARCKTSSTASSACWWRPTSRLAASTSTNSATSSTTTCRWSPTTTSTASAARPARKRPAMRSRSCRLTKRSTSAQIERALGKKLPRTKLPLLPERVAEIHRPPHPAPHARNGSFKSRQRVFR